jgi:flagellar basal-body rod protein FlgB
MKLFDSTLSTLERALDGRLARQGALSSNLANVDTPGFQPKDIDVNRVIDGATPEAALTSASGATAGIDGNAVDADRTLVALAENALQYGAAAKAAGKKLAILRYVASDGAA